MDINNLIDDLRIYSWEAADTLLYYSRLLKKINDSSQIIKNNNRESPVTIADLKVNEIIIERINAKYKNISWEILSEENVKQTLNLKNKKSDWLWVLDPLDGTKDFIQGTKNYAMHLALNYKDEPWLGVVLIPELNELWISYEQEVWCERRDRSLFQINTSHKEKIEEMTLVTSQNHKNQTLESLIDKINFKKRICMGSVGCKISSILRGDSDIYISLSLPKESSPKDWDFAAPHAILNSAGGAITNINNETIKYNGLNFEQRGIIIASNNKKNHGKLCNIIKKIINENNIFSCN